ncbi:kinase-like domain-containing protein [Trametes meyenii]|nr:kinase-like domain-containing protein [Trametes meyenii]
MLSPASGLTLEELKRLLSESAELNVPGDYFRPYYPDDHSVSRSVRLVERYGYPIIVKYGTHVSPVEAETTTFVSRHTPVRVPEVYAVFKETETIIDTDDEQRVLTYIVEERLPGRTIKEAWPFLTASERNAIASELKEIFERLSALAPKRVCLGPLRGPWHNFYFFPFEDVYLCDEHDARTTQAFLSYFQDIATCGPRKRLNAGGKEHIALYEQFDLSRRAVFSHGDLQPCNVMVDGGHVSGIIDWAEAGWYPYFWDSFVLHSSTLTLWRMCGWGKVAATLCTWYPEEAREFLLLWLTAVKSLRAVKTC